MKKPFSKKLLIIDYLLAALLIVGYIVSVIVNGFYGNYIVNQAISNRYDISNIVIPQLLDLNGYGVLLGVWIAQLGVSSAAYYLMLRSEHRLEISTKFVNELPNDIKGTVDMTQVLTTALSVSDN